MEHFSRGTLPMAVDIPDRSRENGGHGRLAAGAGGRRVAAPSRLRRRPPGGGRSGHRICRTTPGRAQATRSRARATRSWPRRASPTADFDLARTLRGQSRMARRSDLAGNHRRHGGHGRLAVAVRRVRGVPAHETLRGRLDGMRCARDVGRGAPCAAFRTAAANRRKGTVPARRERQPPRLWRLFRPRSERHGAARVPSAAIVGHTRPRGRKSLPAQLRRPPERCRQSTAACRKSANRGAT